MRSIVSLFLAAAADGSRAHGSRSGTKITKITKITISDADRSYPHE